MLCPVSPIEIPDSCLVFAAGRVPKTNAIKVYLRALQQREPQWSERIQQVPPVRLVAPGACWTPADLEVLLLRVVSMLQHSQLQVKQVAAIDPGRLRNRPDIPQVSESGEGCANKFRTVKLSLQSHP